jgi:uncharacterized membrane protein YdjX (TVP38/TMEM64 family)
MAESHLPDNFDSSGGQKSLALRVLPLGVLLAGLIAFFGLGLHEYVSFEVLRDNRAQLVSFVEELGWIAGLAFMVLYAVVVAFSLPAGGLMTLTAGFLFGTLTGTFIVVIGATVGASALFLAARTALGDVLKRRLGPSFENIQEGFHENAFSYMMFLRLVPAFPFFIVNLAPAFMKINFRTYFITTLIGIIPGTFVFASIGNGLGAVFESGETPDLSIITSPAILVPLIGLGVLALVPVIVRHVRARRGGA